LEWGSRFWSMGLQVGRVLVIGSQNLNWSLTSFHCCSAWWRKEFRGALIIGRSFTIGSLSCHEEQFTQLFRCWISRVRCDICFKRVNSMDVIKCSCKKVILNWPDPSNLESHLRLLLCRVLVSNIWILTRNCGEVVWYDPRFEDHQRTTGKQHLSSDNCFLIELFYFYFSYSFFGNLASSLCLEGTHVGGFIAFGQAF